MKRATGGAGRIAIAAACAVLLWSAAPLSAQEGAATAHRAVAGSGSDGGMAPAGAGAARLVGSVADTIPVPFASPRTAFVRSLLVPGWGQASLGHYFRGGFYMAAQTASGYMMLKTMSRVGEARLIEEQWTPIVEDSLRREMEMDPALEEELSQPGRFRDAVESDPRIQEAQALVSSRKRQREDWITQTIFWTLASGVDAFVSAHLADFPPDITAEPAAGGGVRLRVSLPVGGVR